MLTKKKDRRPEKAITRSVEGDPELRRAEEEHQRKLVECENDDGSRESEAEREAKRRNRDDQSDQTWTTRGTTRETRKERQKTKENMRKQRESTA